MPNRVIQCLRTVLGLSIFHRHYQKHDAIYWHILLDTGMILQAFPRVFLSIVDQDQADVHHEQSHYLQRASVNFGNLFQHVCL